jgi:hypothetical protein
LTLLCTREPAIGRTSVMHELSHAREILAALLVLWN